ncbi:MAG: NDP-sugar synthase [Prevotellaceae bacterium]|jgi:NDP-sugar pyrophosphorylase family protein|nr:NDP-sugar synthase [Prevotellaceae bacterium]
MNYAILAAGEGSRLAAGGINTPKPLVELNGIPLIERLIDIFVRNGASSLSIIVNPHNQATIEFLQNKPFPIPLNLVIKSTEGSMHSLNELRSFLQDGDFCLTTVDTVFRENEFAEYVAAFRNNSALDGLMAVTDFIDDEKPLYVEVDNQLKITDFCDLRQSGSRYVSGGVYCLRPVVFQALEQTMKSGMSRMRDFQRQLISYQLNLQAFPFSKIVDIDHPDDIAVAEKFLFN